MILRRLVILCCVCFLLIAADSADESFRNGVELFRKGKFAEAIEQFLSAEKAAPEDPASTYNAITSMANAQQLAEMDEKLNEKFASLAKDTSIRANAAYNLGTGYLSVAAAADANEKLPEAAMELEKSIQWLKQSLLDNNDDGAAKNNLEYALKLRKKLEDQQKQDQNRKNDQDQDQKKQDQDQDKQNQNQQNQEQKDQDQNKQQQDQQQNQEQNQQQQQQQQDKKEISDSTAKNLLQAAKDAEKRAMKMLREQQNRKNRKKSPDGKDW